MVPEGFVVRKRAQPQARWLKAFRRKVAARIKTVAKRNRAEALRLERERELQVRSHEVTLREAKRATIREIATYRLTTPRAALKKKRKYQALAIDPLDRVLAYARLFKKQRGLCAVCKKPESAKRPDGVQARLAIDHCHATNRARALLCRRCNIGIGAFKESIVTLRSAIKYLEKFKRLFKMPNRSNGLLVNHV
jgi:hypothetical protein